MEVPNDEPFLRDGVKVAEAVTVLGFLNDGGGGDNWSSSSESGISTISISEYLFLGGRELANWSRRFGVADVGVPIVFFDFGVVEGVAEGV